MHEAIDMLPTHRHTHTVLLWCVVFGLNDACRLSHSISFTCQYNSGLFDCYWISDMTSQWRNNERDGVSNHQPHDCLLNRLFRRRSKKTSKLRVTGLCAGISSVADYFPTQMISNAENGSIWWSHHDFPIPVGMGKLAGTEPRTMKQKPCAYLSAMSMNRLIWVSHI